MTKEEAEKMYAAEMEVDCPDCRTKAGALCDTPGVWVHLGRMYASGRLKPAAS